VSFKYPHGVRFECLRCATCCGDTSIHARHILLLEQEVQCIAKATFRFVEGFAGRIEGHEPYVYEMKKTAEDGKCVFLKSKSCTIYEHRPVICRFYPFEFRSTKNGVPEFCATDECLGIGKGARLLKEGYFEVLVRRLEQVLDKPKTDSVSEYSDPNPKTATTRPSSR
jgi:Fe-S-cluster containining protein